MATSRKPGRPKALDKRVNKGVTLPTSKWEVLDNWATAMGVSVSKVIESLIDIEVTGNRPE